MASIVDQGRLLKVKKVVTVIANSSKKLFSIIYKSWLLSRVRSKVAKRF